MREDDKLNKTLRLLAPGTPLREGLDNILRARTGALIVIGDTPQVLSLTEGGFPLTCEMQPASLYELAKMDGAIILSHDAKRILYANTQLVPDSSIPSSETGIRHRTAERVAKQTGELVISISQRRNMITLYWGFSKYILRDINAILAKANQALQTLEKYRSVLDQSLTNLTAAECEDMVTLLDVVTVFQRMEMVRRISSEIERYVVELGTEGRLVSMQKRELTAQVENEALLLTKDYCQTTDGKTAEGLLAQMAALSADDVVDPVPLVRILGFGSSTSMELNIAPRGYRIVSKIPRLPPQVIDNLVQSFSKLSEVMQATTDQLDDVEGIGEVRARAIRDGLRRLQEQALLDRHL
ncbi:MAG: DNA integrity scanning diadenylate cyclase DisA [Bacillota bacterium]